MKHSKGLTKRTMIVLILLGLLFIFLIYLQASDFLRIVSKHNQSLYDEYDRQIETVIETYQKTARIYIEEVVVDNPDIINQFSAAFPLDESARRAYRENIYDLLKDTYQRAIEKDFRQFHFHFPDCTSFLRVHKPEIYGDDLSGIRETIRATSETQTASFGFEEGRIYNGYRFVFPLFKDEVYLGSVETSISPAAILNTVNNTMRSKGVFIIKKDITDKKVFSDVIDSNYMDCDISDAYYYDRETYHNFFSGDSKISILNILDINEYLKERIISNVESGKPAILHTKFDDCDYTISLLPIENFSGDQMGYFIFYQLDSTFSAFLRTFIMNLVLTITLWAVISFYIFNSHKNQEKLLSLSITDKLTGLFNRRGFFLKAQTLFYFSERQDELWICFIDMDKLKSINDSFGHDEGDKAIMTLAEILKNCFRKSDVIGRIGGDEFVVCGIDKSDEDRPFLERIHHALDIFNESNEKSYSLSVSTGCLIKDDSMKGKTLEELIKIADNKMYERKRQKSEKM